MYVPPEPRIGDARCARRVYYRTTYREVGGCGPGSCALDVADEGLVDVAGADEAVREG